VTHQFVTAGAHLVTLTVVVNGQTYPITANVSVSDQNGGGPPPVLLPFDFHVDAFTVKGAVIPNTYTITIFATDGTSSANEYDLNFGDGSPTIKTSKTTYTYVYQDGNAHTITLTVPGYTGSVTHPNAPTVTHHRPAHH